MIRQAKRKTALFLAICLISALLPASLPSSMADTPGRGYINYNKVYFRKTPSTAANAEYWCFLDYNWPVTILSSVYNTFGSWYEIRAALPSDTAREVDGYVLTRYVSVTASPVTSAPTAAPTAAPAESQLAYVNTDKVYFRREAGYKTDTWAVLPIDWPVFVTGFTLVNNVKWYAVTSSLPGDAGTAVNGYIHSDYVTMGVPMTPEPEPQASSQPQDAADDPLDAFSGCALALFDGVNVRLTENNTSAAVTALQAGQIVEVLGGVGSDSLYIRAQTAEGYVSADSLYLLSFNEYAALTDPSAAVTQTPAEAEIPSPDPSAFSGFAMVLKDGAGVRLAADPAFLPAASLLSGDIVSCPDGIGGTMVRVIAPDVEGYMLAEDLAFLTVREYLDLTEPDPAPSAEPAAPTAPALSPAPSAEPEPTSKYQVLGYIQLTRGGVNLRETPAGDTLTPTEETQLNTYTFLPYLKQPVYAEGYYWIFVFSSDLNMYGYIRSDCYQFVTATPAPEITAEPAEQGSEAVTGYLRLTVPAVNLRESPNGKSLTPRDEDKMNTSSPIPYYGTPVSKAGYEWARVEYNGMTGYVRSDCYELLLATETPVPTAVPEPELQGYIILTADKVNIRRTPGGTILAQAAEKTIFPCYGETAHDGDIWYMIYYRAKKTYAYVLSSLAQTYTYITPTPSPSPVPEITPTPAPAAVTVRPAVTPAPVEAQGYVITTASKVYIRLSPSISSMALTLVADMGTVIMTTGDRIQDGKDAWYPVFYNGFNGCISAAFASELSPWQAEVYLEKGVVPTPSPVPAAAEGEQAAQSPAEQETEAAPEAETETETETVTEGSPEASYEEAVLPAEDGAEEAVPQDEAAGEAVVGGDAALPGDNGEDDAFPVIFGEIEVTIPDEYRLLSLNCSGDDVTELQKALVLLNYLEQSEISGEFLASTQTAVLNFQLDFDLTLTGIVDEETWNSIFDCFLTLD